MNNVVVESVTVSESSCAYSFVFAVERASDDEPADLAGAGADLVELAVAHDPPRRVVVDVPVAAQDLMGSSNSVGSGLKMLKLTPNYRRCPYDYQRQ